MTIRHWCGCETTMDADNNPSKQVYIALQHKLHKDVCSSDCGSGKCGCEKEEGK